jgi:replicative DNA helicase
MSEDRPEYKTGKKRLAGLADKAVETPVHPDQREVEMKLLAVLASVINSDQAVLKYDLLELTGADFHFRDHRAIFAAMKELTDGGDHVDMVTVRAKVGDAWTDTLKAVFAGSGTDPGAADTYKRKVIFWSNIAQARGVGLAYLADVEAAASAAEADLPGLVANLQKTVFDIAKTDRLSPPLRSEADLTDNFVLDLESPKPGYRTGFTRTDQVIKGLRPGLFVIAAPPSAGKTTYVKQLADQVAELNEAPVLFFSYEQSADELRVKSLARLTKKAGTPCSNESIKEGLGIPQRIEAAAVAYKRFGKWIKIIEGDRQHTVGRIRLLAQREKMLTGKAPLIIIDYLQILPVNDPSLRDKRSEVDFLVSELRRIARDIEAPVIAISAMSRAEYDRAKMSGFKESGGIEYGADLAAIMTVEKESDNGSERTVALNILKNRNGRRGKAGMKYDMVHDHFEEEDFQNLSYLETLGKEQET